MSNGAKTCDMRLLARLCARAKNDPLLWAETAWQWGEGDLKDKDIRAWQADVMDDIAKHLADPDKRFNPLWLSVASGHGVGKSALFGMVTNWAMSCWRGSRVVITANTEGQLRTKTSPEVAKWFATSMSASLFNIDTLSIRARQSSKETPWVMDFIPWSEHNTEAFAGLHNEGKIIVIAMDEGSAIPDKIWEVIEGAMTDENTVVIWLVCGNPTRNVGRFRECFRKYKKVWKKYQIDSRTVEGTNKKFLRQQIELYGENSDYAKVRVKGQFPTSSTNQLIPTDLIDNARGRHIPKTSYDFAPSILTCDPAWSGDDILVIGHRQGLMFEILEVIPKNDNDVLIANKLARYETELKADAVFVDFGYGTGIVSAGTTMGRTWELVNFASAAPSKAHKNMRAFMWDSVRLWLKEGGAIPDDDDLYEDLVNAETKPTLDGAILLKSKQELKKDLLCSPDRGDALALSFARVVVKKDMTGIGPRRLPVGRSKYVDENGDYNPQA